MHDLRWDRYGHDDGCEGVGYFTRSDAAEFHQTY
jgi:hypothetical protein